MILLQDGSRIGSSFQTISQGSSIFSVCRASAVRNVRQHNITSCDSCVFYCSFLLLSLPSRWWTTTRLWFSSGAFAKHSAPRQCRLSGLPHRTNNTPATTFCLLTKKLLLTCADANAKTLPLSCARLWTGIVSAEQGTPHREAWESNRQPSLRHS